MIVPEATATLPDDAALPGLAVLHDRKRRIDLLSPLLADWLGASYQLVECEVSLLSYLPARRIVVLLDLVVTVGGTAEHRSVVAKLYAADQDPAAVHATVQALQQHGFGSGSLCVPRSIGIAARYRMQLAERAPGDVLRQLLVEGRTGPAAIQRAADWLLRLHTCGLGTGRVYTFERHLYTLGTWQARLADALPEAGRLFAEVLVDVDRRGRKLAGWQPAPTHRDFSPDHLVLDGERVSGLDLDEFCQYDPLFDVAHFVAHLRLLGMLHFGALHHFDRHAAHFEQSYAAHAPDCSVERVRLYLAIAALKLAFLCACVKRPSGWRQIAMTLLRSARSDCPGR